MKKKKLIAIITNNDDDIYCFRKELIETLIEQGYEVLISCPYGEKFELMKKINYIYDDPIIDRRGTNILKDLKLLYHYNHLFKRLKPDVVLTYTAKPNVYAGMAAKKNKIPYICNVTGLGSIVNKKGLIKRFILWLFKKTYRNAACVMFQNSSNMQLALNKRMIKGKYKLIPGSGVDLNRFSLQPYPKGGNGIIGDAVIFNYIGRILHEKGVDDFIRVAKEIKKMYPKTEFNIIGFIEPTEQHYEIELKKLEEEKILYYRGSQKDIKPWIARAHAIIHPSIYGEGMSNVLLENAASGRPIITTDNPGCKETVVNNVTGYIYKKNDFSELINFVKLFLKTDNYQRELMGIKGREHVEKNFSRTIVINEYLMEIERILSNEIK